MLCNCQHFIKVYILYQSVKQFIHTIIILIKYIMFCLIFQPIDCTFIQLQKSLQYSKIIKEQKMILDAIFVLLIIAILVMIYKIKFSKSADSQQRLPEERVPLIPQWRPQQRQQQQQIISDISSEDQKQGPVDRRKQMIKERKKHQRQQRKLARQQMLASQKQKRQQYEKQQQQKQREQQQKAKKQQQYYDMLAQQQRKRKQQQFNKWKNFITVQTSGNQRISPDQQKRKKQQLDNNIIQTLKKNKLSLLEDLSHKYHLPTKEIIDKIKDFQDRGLVDGIFDERGKYMIIETNQWIAIKNYIAAKGRVKKTDIMNECSRIIKIPERQQSDQITKLIQNQTKQIK